MKTKVVPLGRGRFFWHLEGKSYEYVGIGKYADLQAATRQLLKDEGAEYL